VQTTVWMGAHRKVSNGRSFGLMRELFRLFVTDDANARNFHRMRPAEQTREFSEVCSSILPTHGAKPKAGAAAGAEARVPLQRIQKSNETREVTVTTNMLVLS
jgi:hypothetical protein